MSGVFAVGDLVEKYDGEARWVGVVVSTYETLRGARRLVVDVLPQRFQMIASPTQLRLVAAGLTREAAIGAGLALVSAQIAAQIDELNMRRRGGA